jgi:glutathione S-transferase
MSSINVKKVVWAAQELGLDFERTDTGGAFGLTQTPEALQRNPNALVPVLDDDGFVLWESNVMVRYLCKKHSPGGWYPGGLQDLFNAERWMVLACDSPAG